LDISDVEQAEFGIGVTYADESQGTWQYLRTDLPGHQWTDFQLGDPDNIDATPVPNGEVILFDADTILRFIPDAGFSNDAEIQFRVWDGTVGVASNPPSTVADDSGGAGAPFNQSSLSTASFVATLVADTDGDGIINSDDVDDDNDGILDTDEGLVETVGNYGTILVDDADTTFEITANNDANQLTEFLFQTNSAVTITNAVINQGDGSVPQIGTFDWRQRF